MTPSPTVIAATAGCLLLVALGCGASAGEPGRGSAGEPELRPPLGLTSNAPSTYRRVCREQASIAPPRARRCPPLIPGGPLEVETAGRFSKQKRYRGGYSANLASCSLNRLHGRRIQTNGCHWIYEIAWATPVRRLVGVGVRRPPNASQPSTCRRLSVEGEAMEACRVVPFEKGGGMHGGHIAYLWSRGGVLHVVSLHGYSNEPRARAMIAALAETTLAETPTAASR